MQVMQDRSILSLLLSVLLLSQTAISQHDIAHEFIGHTELCAVFVTADQATDCALPQVVLALPDTEELDFSLRPIRIFQARLSHYSSRAPPTA